MANCADKIDYSNLQLISRNHLDDQIQQGLNNAMIYNMILELYMTYKLTFKIRII